MFKKWNVLLSLVAVCALALSACQPKTVIVEKEVKVTQVVTQIIKETVVVEGTPKTVEREVTKIVEKEKVVTPTPDPDAINRGGTFIQSSFSDPENLNPVLSVDNASNEVISYIFNAVVTLDPKDGSVIPDLAERWEISDDNLVFTFYLRKDVTWHDGEPFTAHDVKFTYDITLDENVNSPNRSGLADILTPEQIVVLDDYTIQFTLSQVDAAFLVSQIAANSIVPRHILGEMTPEEFNAADFNNAPIGTGPFMFREWVHDDHVAMVKNPNYFEGEPNLDFVYYKIVENQTVEFAQLQTGEIDYAPVTAAFWEEAQKTANLECTTYPDLGFLFYIYQLDPEKSPLFLDVRTRQALLYGLDRQAFVDSIALGLADVAHSTIPPISWAHNPDNEPKYDYNVEKAKALLEEAGWKDEDGDGVREAHGVMGVQDGTPFSFSIHTNAGNNERESAMVAAQQYWAEIGVEAKPVAVEWNALLAELTETFEYEIIIVGFGWGVDPDQKSMWHTDSYGNGFNMNKYSDPRIDELLDAALKTTDQEKRKEYYYEMQHILAQQVPAPIIYFRRNTVCWNKRVHGLDPNTIFDGLDAGDSYKWWVDR